MCHCGKREYNSPSISIRVSDIYQSLVMMSDPIGGPGELGTIDGWPESGWTQKLFKIIFR